MKATIRESVTRVIIARPFINKINYRRHLPPWLDALVLMLSKAVIVKPYSHYQHRDVIAV